MSVERLIIKPCELPDIEHRSFRAYAYVTPCGFFHAAETRSQSARHHVLQRHLTFQSHPDGIFCYSHHHGLRSTDRYPGEIRFAEKGMLCDESLLSCQTCRARQEKRKNRSCSFTQSKIPCEKQTSIRRQKFFP